MLLSAFSRLFLVLLAGIALSGCELAEGIFKAGMAFGVFIVIAIVALVIFLVSKVAQGRSCPAEASGHSAKAGYHRNQPT